MRSVAVVVLLVAGACREPLDVPDYDASADAPLFADAGQGTSVVVTSQVTLDASASKAFGNHISTYLWEQIGDGFAPLDDAGAKVTHAYLEDVGAYTFRVTVTDDGGYQATSDVVFESLAPDITVAVTAPSPVPVGVPMTITGMLIIDPEVDIQTSLNWSLVDPSFQTHGLPQTFTPDFRPDLSGTYTVTMTITTAFGTYTAMTSFVAQGS